MRFDVFDTVDAEALHINDRPLFEAATATDRMQTRKHAPECAQGVQVVQLGCATAAAREQCDRKFTDVMQTRFRVLAERRDHRQTLAHEIETELMLFADLRIAPAQRSIELRDQRLAIFDADLIDTILITVQREQATIGDIALRLDCRQHEVWRERVERMQDVGVQRRSLAASAAT